MPNKPVHKGDENLVPMNKRSKEEARALGAKGGKASGKKRQYNRSMKEGLKILMNMAPNRDIADTFSEQLGIPPEEIKTNAMLANAALMGRLIQGDTKAYQIAHDALYGKEETAELKIKKAELKIKQEQHEMDMAEWKARREGNKVE